MGSTLPGSSIHRILQARILEWVAIPISRDLPNPESKPRPPALQADSWPSEPPGKHMPFPYQVWWRGCYTHSKVPNSELFRRTFCSSGLLQASAKRGLPWWSGGLDFPCQREGHGFDSWSRKIPHASEQLSPLSCNDWSLRILEPLLQKERSHCNETPVHHI